MDDRKTIYINLALPAHFLKEIDEAAKRRRMNRSEYIRCTLSEALDRLPKPTDVKSTPENSANADAVQQLVDLMNK